MVLETSRLEHLLLLCGGSWLSSTRCWATSVTVVVVLDTTRRHRSLHLSFVIDVVVVVVTRDAMSRVPLVIGSLSRGGWLAPAVGGDMMSRREGCSASGAMVVWWLGRRRHL